MLADSCSLRPISKSDLDYSPFLLIEVSLRMSIPKKNRGRYNPASEEFSKEEFPFYWLAQVHGRYSQAMERILKKIDLDVPQYRILFILKENGESSISEITTQAIAKLSTTTKIVYRMKEDGLLETSQCSTDGRVTRVGLTPSGLEAIDAIQKATDKLFHQSYEGLTEPQIHKLNKVLQIIFHNLPED